MQRFFLLILLTLPAFTLAQTSPLKPIATEQEISDRYFELPPDVHHHFVIGLPQDNFLIIEFPRLSDWQDQGAFRSMLQQAANISARMKDSLKNPASAYRLDIHLPVKNTPATVRIKESAGNGNFMMLNDHDEAPLKIGMDTVRVLKNMGEKEVDGELRKTQVQYTFILKEMGQLQQLAGDEDWIASTAGMTDSIVQTYRRKWRDQDAWFHDLYVSYRPNLPGSPLVINQKEREEDSRGIFKAIKYDISFGMSLVRDRLGPNTEIGLSYIPYQERRSALFFRLSASSLALFERKPDEQFKAYPSTFVNIEIGTTNVDKMYTVPMYLASMGFGVKIGNKNDHPSFQRDWYKLFFRYNITKAITIKPEFYMTTKRDDEGFVGMTVNLRIL